MIGENNIRIMLFPVEKAIIIIESGNRLVVGHAVDEPIVLLINYQLTLITSF